jgi:integrase
VPTDTGETKQGATPTHGDYLEHHSLPAVKGQLEASTFATCRMIIRTRVIPRLGREPLRDLQAPCSEAGVALIRLHDLRHSHARLMIEAGVHVKVITERLGHKSGPGFTYTVYSHARPTMQADAARTAGTFLQAARGQWRPEQQPLR